MMYPRIMDLDLPAAGSSPSAQRISTLRRRCRERKTTGGAAHYRRLLGAASLRATEGKPWPLRVGKRTRAILEGLPLALDDLELLIGRPAAFADDADELAAADAYLRQFPPAPGQTGHCELDLSRVFSDGLDAMRQMLLHLQASAPPFGAATYQSFIDALAGLSAMIEHAAYVAETAMTQASPARGVELHDIAASCRHIAHHAPRSFREAIQLLWLIDLGVMVADEAGLVVPGRLDRTLWPFYKHDIARGTLTRSAALELIECLYILINEFIPDGLAMSVMVGGRDSQGKDVSNDLSYLCLEALRRTRMIYPTVGICHHDGTPTQLVELAIDLISDGLTTPAFFNDDTIQHGLKALDVSAEDACNYINSTCVEITPVAGSNVWVASPYFNLPGILLEEMSAQTSLLTPTPTFEAFLSAYELRLADKITQAVAEQNQWREQRRLHGRKPLQSVFTRDCIVRGRDIDDGGARYNWVECSFVGLANLADSLFVLKHEVFAAGAPLTLAHLKPILDANFAGHEATRQRFMHRYAKYGNADAGVDGLVQRITGFLRDECKRHTVQPYNSSFVPGTFCWIMHEQLGKDTGATPDGRLAGVALADAAGPAQGREKNGPTAAIRSTTCWDHSVMIGGLAYNMKFSAALFQSPDSCQQLRDLVLTYLRLGGFETQINIVSRETLLQARAHPEQYADLVVRIGGYCDYFTRLSPRMQDEIIQRAEFEAL
jgi:formate C-acetyltransferase